MAGVGMVRGSREWLMTLRVYYSGEAEVVALLEMYEKAAAQIEAYKRIFNEEMSCGKTTDKQG